MYTIKFVLFLCSIASVSIAMEGQHTASLKRPRSAVQSRTPSACDCCKLSKKKCDVIAAGTKVINQCTYCKKNFIECSISPRKRRGRKAKVNSFSSMMTVNATAIQPFADVGYHSSLFSDNMYQLNLDKSEINEHFKSSDLLNAIPETGSEQKNKSYNTGIDTANEKDIGEKILANDEQTAIQPFADVGYHSSLFSDNMYQLNFDKSEINGHFKSGDLLNTIPETGSEQKNKSSNTYIDTAKDAQFFIDKIIDNSDDQWNLFEEDTYGLGLEMWDMFHNN